MSDESTFYIDCRHCSFSGVVDTSNEQRPAEVVIAHGRRFDHQLSVESREDHQ